MERDSFIFYKSWIEGVEGFSEREQAEVCLALLRYCAYGVEPENPKRAVRLAFAYAKPQIDANNSRYSAGRSGGAPSGNQNARRRAAGGPGDSGGKTVLKQPTVVLDSSEKTILKQPTVVLGCSEKTILKQPNENENENVNENENENVNETGRAFGASPSCSSSPPAEGDAPAAPLQVSAGKKRGIREQAASIAEYYNARIAETGARLVSCKALSPRRIGLISARLAEYGPAQVREMIDKAAASRFLNFEAVNAPVSIDWLFRPNNFPKVLEGSYNDRAAPPPRSRPDDPLRAYMDTMAAIDRIEAGQNGKNKETTH